MTRALTWTLALTVALAGCATGPVDTGGPEPEPDAGADPSQPTPDAGDAGQDGQPSDDGDAAPADAADAGDGAQAGQAATPGGQPSYPPAIEAGSRVTEIRTSPSPIEITVGDTVSVDDFEYTPVDVQGQPVEGPQVLFGLIQEREAMVTRERTLVGLDEGAVQMVLAVMAPPPSGEGQPQPKIFRAPVVVNGRPVASVEIAEPEYAVYTGTSVPLTARPLTAEGEERTTARVEWSSRNPDVAQVTSAGFVRGISAGNATLVALSEGVEGTLEVQVRENPVQSVELSPADPTVATGDVVRFEAVARDGSGQPVEDVATSYAVVGVETERARRAGGGAAVHDGNAFVASAPGSYRVVASAGTVSAETVVTAEPRGVARELSGVGQGIVSHHPSSDLWVFQGQDGRDYAYVGTHSGGQKMFAWDVTDPASPVITDSVVVDARVVNDVKVNEDASIAVITREGASDRQNGIVLLDISDPAHPVVLSEYTETVTGGVHNVFIVDDLVYAVHDGSNDMHIIDISDPMQPTEVGRWGIDSAFKSLHDIWIVDGLAYLSYWDDGIYVLDVGDGRWGGTPTQPAEVSTLSYTSLPGEWGNTHVAFPYTNSDGHSYLFVGDEVFGCEECRARSGGHLEGPRGYVHILDMEDPENPVEVARYEVPEAGVHNLWIDDDKLYAAYYQAGLRVVDISGELRGNLYDQGREIGWYATASPDGNTPNQAMAWGPQPYGDEIFVSDLNSGLWVVRLEPPERPVLP